MPGAIVCRGHKQKVRSTPLQPCARLRWHKVEAECCALFVCGLGKQSRQALQDSEKNKISGVAMSQSNSVEKKIYGELLCLTATVDE